VWALEGLQEGCGLMGEDSESAMRIIRGLQNVITEKKQGVGVQRGEQIEGRLGLQIRKYSVVAKE